MVFWGAQVKPWKPISFPRGEGITKLRITRATLGVENDSKRTCLLECTVGFDRPIFLCALMPGKVESCQLDFEFEPTDLVVFSVHGNKSIHLSGYSVTHNQPRDTDSDGIDIENYEIESSSVYSEDNDYDYLDDFIDDTGLLARSPFPAAYYRGNKDQMDRSKQVMKQKQVVDSDDDSWDDDYILHRYKSLKSVNITECGTSGVKVDNLGPVIIEPKDLSGKSTKMIEEYKKREVLISPKPSIKVDPNIPPNDCQVRKRTSKKTLEEETSKNKKK